MHYDKFQYVNTNLTETVDFLMSLTTSGYVALTDCHYELGPSTTDRPRMEANASWATFHYYKTLLIYIEADVIADTPQHYATFKLDLIRKLMVPPDIIQTTRLQGQINMRPAGITQDYQLPVVVSEPPMFPTAKNAPSAQQMTMTFKAFRPYWHRATSDDYVWAL